MNRFERLINHLEEVEKQTGKKLRTMPRFHKAMCPMENFAPVKDKHGREFHGCYRDGRVLYWEKGHLIDTDYVIYIFDDSNWWNDLSASQQRKITNKVIKYLKGR